MKKFLKNFLFLVIFTLFLCAPAMASESYAELYNNAQPADFELINGIDPYQNEDYYKFAYSPYPLFRLALDIKFKNLTIPAGYYILTPRNMHDRDFVFFKENGKVKYIVPVVKKEVVEPGFYETNIPTPQLTKWQTFCKNTKEGFYKLFKNSSKKSPPPQSFIRTEYIEGNMFLIILYYGSFKYHLVFRSGNY